MSLKAGTWLRFLVSAGLMALLLGWMVDLPAAWRAIQNCHWGWIVLLAGWITLDRVLMAYKWRLLLACRGLNLGMWEALKAYYLASFAGCFLPSTVGGDAMRVAALASQDLPGAALAASVVMERALGFLAAAIAALLALLLLTGLAVELPHGLMAWSAGIAGAVALVVVASLSNWLADWMQKLPERLADRGRLLRLLGKFLAAYGTYRHHRPTLLAFLLLSLIEQGFPVVGTWLAGEALHIHLSLIHAAAVAPLALLFTRIPISLSGFGVVEGLYVAFFALVGIGATDAFLLGLLGDLSVLVTTVPGALFFTGGGVRIRRTLPRPPGPLEP